MIGCKTYGEKIEEKSDKVDTWINLFENKLPLIDVHFPHADFNYEKISKDHRKFHKNRLGHKNYAYLNGFPKTALMTNVM